MIDFRYHLVSIIAVFLALGVGLLVGATALSPQAETLLRKAQTELSRTNASLSNEKKLLNQQVNADQTFAQANSGRLLGGLLTGETVVLVIAPGADGTVIDGVTGALRQAGARVTGQVNLNQAFLDTSGPTESTLTQLAQRLQNTAGISLPSQPDSPAVAGQQQAAAVLAAAIVSKSAGLPANASQSILNGFGNGGFLSVNSPNGSTTLAAASLAVLVVPQGLPAPGDAGVNASQALVAVAQELNAASHGTVMAGGVSSIGADTPISIEINAGHVSTVDNADTEIGQIMVAQALRLSLDGKSPAQYGVEPGAAPSPAPTPNPTLSFGGGPSPKASASPGGRK